MSPVALKTDDEYSSAYLLNSIDEIFFVFFVVETKLVSWESCLQQVRRFLPNNSLTSAHFQLFLYKMRAGCEISL